MLLGRLRERNQRTEYRYSRLYHTNRQHNDNAWPIIRANLLIKVE